MVSVLRADNREISGLIGKENQVAHTTSSAQIIRTCVCVLFCILYDWHSFSSVSDWMKVGRPILK